MRLVDVGLVKVDLDEHPGFAESMIPVWGSGREALADWHDGDYAGAAGNALLAASDLIPGATLAKVGVKAAARGAKLGWKAPVKKVLKEAGRGVVKLDGSMTWNAVRKDLKDAGVKPFGWHGHHAIIPQNGWGRRIPDAIKNQPINIKVLSPSNHTRIHGPYKGKPQFDPVRRVWYGTPDWAKGAAVSAGGRTIPGRGER